MSMHADRVKTLYDDLARLQDRIAREAEGEARASDRIARATDSFSRASSMSSAQSYQRDIQSQQRELVRHQTERARLSKEVAQKQKDLAYHQKELMSEQQRETKTTSELLRRLQNESRSQQERALHSVAPVLSLSGAAEEHDAFICHSSEDKEDLVRPLANALVGLGSRIWYDEFTLKVGDSLRRSIDRGLAGSRFGIVVLSASFFAKNWTQYELDGLVAKENQGNKVILPLWHRVSKNDVLGYSPTLADRVALSTAMFTIDELAAKLHEVLNEGNPAQQ
jgi:hypothetical protein